MNGDEYLGGIPGVEEGDEYENALAYERRLASAVRDGVDREVDANEEVFFDEEDEDDLEANGGSDDDDRPVGMRTQSWSSPPTRGRKETEEEKVELNRVMTRVFDDMQSYLENIPLAPQPVELLTPLMDHQRQALFWLCSQEDKGALRSGVLADDMGVGKTIETLALLCSRRRDRTIIICPMTMLQHWRNEIEKHIYPNTFRVLTYYGNQRPKTIDELSRAHIVITTYGTLSAEYKKLSAAGVSPETLSAGQPLPAALSNTGTSRCFLYSIPWDRVILDEAQYVKNRSSVSSRATCALCGGFRFALTGTPISNTLDDLFALLVFARFPDYPDYKEWRTGITKLIASHNSLGYRRLAELLRRCMLRRRKDQMLKGKPIVELPAVTSNTINLDFDPEDNLFYYATEERINYQFEAMAKRGQNYVMKHYTHVLVLLLRLRQAACHPYLVAMANVYTPEDAGAVAQGRGAWNFDVLEDFTKQTIEQLKTVRQDIIEQQEAAGQKALSEIELMKMITQRVAMSFVTNTEGAPCLKCSRAAEDPIITPCRHIFCRRCIPEKKSVSCNRCHSEFDNEGGRGVEPATTADLHIAAEFAKDPFHRAKADPLFSHTPQKQKTDPSHSGPPPLPYHLAKANTFSGQPSRDWYFVPGSQPRTPRVLATITLDDDDDDILAPLRRPAPKEDPICLDEEDVLAPLTFLSQSTPPDHTPVPLPLPVISPLASAPIILKPDPISPGSPPPPIFDSMLDSKLSTTPSIPYPSSLNGSDAPANMSGEAPTTTTPGNLPLSEILPSVPTSITDPSVLDVKVEDASNLPRRTHTPRTRLTPIPRQTSLSPKNIVISRAKLNEPSLFKPTIAGLITDTPLDASPSRMSLKGKTTTANEEATQSISALTPVQPRSEPDPRFDMEEEDRIPSESTMAEAVKMETTENDLPSSERQSTVVYGADAMELDAPVAGVDDSGQKSPVEDDLDVQLISNASSRLSSGFFQQGLTRLDSPPQSYISRVDRTINSALTNLAAVKPIRDRRDRNQDVDDLEESEERSEDDDADNGSDLDDFIVDDDDGDDEEGRPKRQKNVKKRRRDVGDMVAAADGEAGDSEYHPSGKAKRKKMTQAQWEEANQLRPQDLVENFGRFAPAPEFEVRLPTNAHLTGAEAKRALAKYVLKRHSTKLTALLSALELIKASQSDDKIVIYSQFTRYLDVIEAPLRQWGWKMLRLDGKMTQQARAATLSTFDKDPDCRIIIISIKAGGVGINLTVANHIFLMDPWWNTAVEKQAVDRVHRIGQKKAIFVTRFFVNQTVEQRILAIQAEKDRITDRALSNTRGDVAPRKGLTFNELRQLFSSSFRQNEDLPAPLISRDPQPDQIHFMPTRTNILPPLLPPPSSSSMDVSTPQPTSSTPDNNYRDQSPAGVVKPERRGRPARQSQLLQTQPLDPFRPL